MGSGLVEWAAAPRSRGHDVRILPIWVSPRCGTMCPTLPAQGVVVDNSTYKLFLLISYILEALLSPDRCRTPGVKPRRVPPFKCLQATSIGRQALHVVVQYASRRFGWTIARASFLISFKGAVNLAALFVVLPWLTARLGRRMGPARKDLCLAGQRRAARA